MNTRGSSLRSKENKKDKWDKVGKSIKSWLKVRDDLVTEFNLLSGVYPPGLRKETEGSLRKFKQLLVDYVSARHFNGLFNAYPSDNTSIRSNTFNKYQSNMAEISKTTNYALEFDKKYGSKSHEALDRNKLVADLVNLMDKLESRFTIDSELIRNLEIKRKLRQYLVSRQNNNLSPEPKPSGSSRKRRRP